MLTYRSNRSSYWRAKTSEEELLAYMILDTLRSNGLSGWSVIFNKDFHVLGKCFYGSREILISRRVMTNWVEAVDVAMHEAAHALTASEIEDHGPLWKKKAIELGSSGEVKNSSFLDRSRNGSKITLETNFGNVDVVLGETEIVFESKTCTIYEVARKKIHCIDGQNNRYKISKDHAHPDYGKVDKIKKSIAYGLNSRGKKVKIPIGERFNIPGFGDVYPLEVRTKKVLAMTKSGKSYLVNIDWFRS